MSEATQAIKKRRKRMATPPLDDATERNSNDIYDSVVSHTFCDLRQLPTTVTLTVPLSPALDESSNLAQMTQATSLSSDLKSKSWHLVSKHPEKDVDLCDSPSSSSSSTPPDSPAMCEPRTTSVVEESSPPPPDYIPPRRRRLDNGVQAALNKLEKAAQDTPEPANINNDVLQITEHSDQIRVLVKIGGDFCRYKLFPNDKIVTLQTLISEEKKIPPSHIMLFCNDNVISDDDTVSSLGLTVADTIEALIIDKNQQSTLLNDTSAKLTLKVQGKHGQRDVLSISLEPNEPLEVLMKQFAETKDLDLSKLQFYFDGDLVTATDTPTKLDMEDGDCIDVRGY